MQDEESPARNERLDECGKDPMRNSILKAGEGESWPTAAVPMDSPYCSCKPTRVRLGPVVSPRTPMTKSLSFSDRQGQVITYRHGHDAVIPFLGLTPRRMCPPQPLKDVRLYERDLNANQVPAPAARRRRYASLCIILMHLMHPYASASSACHPRMHITILNRQSTPPAAAARRQLPASFWVRAPSGSGCILKSLCETVNILTERS